MTLLTVSVALTFLATISARAQTRASFTGLGILGTGNRSIAFDLSSDGRVVVGLSHYGHQSTAVSEAFRWTSQTGIVGLGDLNGGIVSSQAHAVSADGSVVVGDTEGHGFRWTALSGMQDLGEWVPLGISADGSVIVGYQEIFFVGRVGVRWTEVGGLENLGSLPGRNVDAFLADASADGGVLVGQSWSGDSGVEPVRWDAQSGLVGLGDLPGGIFYALGFAISDDGGVLAGWGISDAGQEAFRWTMTTGYESLDPVASLTTTNVANGISADGRLIVGYAESVGGAALWDERHGFRNLQGLLEGHGVSIGAWQLGEATAVERTDQAIVVVGYGRNPAGLFEGWSASFPPRAVRRR